MIEYRFARPEEEADILDFIDLVFSQSARPHDFVRMLPKVYAHPGYAGYHAVAVRDGRVRAAVASLPLTVDTRAGDSLRGGFIGSVSVHGKERGQGHMRALMDLQIADAREKGYDFLALGGQRQRYGHWGFERCGAAARFSVNQSNVRHALADADADSITLEPLSGPDDPGLDTVAALYEQRPMHCLRPRALLYDTLCSYGGEPFLVRDGKTGAPAGYLVQLGDSIAEWGFADSALTEPVIKHWMRDRKNGAVVLPLSDTDGIVRLSRFAESFAVHDAILLKVLNWPRVLGAALRLKARLSSLPAGEMTVEIAGAGRYRLAVRGDQAAAEPTEQAPDCVLDERQAVAFFFSPLNALLSADHLTRCWLPLPMDFPEPDHF